MVRQCLYLFSILLLFSCGKLGLYSNPKGGKIATVGTYMLFEQDINSYFLSHPFISDSDSIALRNSFIENWIKDMSLQSAANEHLSQSSSLAVDEIEERVAQYRNQLVLYEYENSYVEQLLDTVVSNALIQEYYNNHISSFKLPAPIIKCTIARIPAGVRQSSKLENLFISKKRDDVSEFLEICNKNNYLIMDFSENWVDLSEVIKVVPVSIQNADTHFSKRSFYSIEDDTWRYMIKIDSYLSSGALIPLEREVANIKKILLHERSMKLRSQLEDSILNSAYKKGIITRL